MGCLLKFSILHTHYLYIFIRKVESKCLTYLNYRLSQSFRIITFAWKAWRFAIAWILLVQTSGICIWNFLTPSTTDSAILKNNVGASVRVVLRRKLDFVTAKTKETSYFMFFIASWIIFNYLLFINFWWSESLTKEWLLAWLKRSTFKLAKAVTRGVL